jgi:hypothetical protein
MEVPREKSNRSDERVLIFFPAETCYHYYFTRARSREFEFRRSIGRCEFSDVHTIIDSKNLGRRIANVQAEVFFSFF